MPEDKDPNPSPSRPDYDRGQKHGDQGDFQRQDPLQKGYQTPQDHDEHWKDPSRDK